MWKDHRNGHVVSGEPVEQSEAEHMARAMNEAWPEIYHWAAPVPRPAFRPSIPYEVRTWPGVKGARLKNAPSVCS